MEQDLTSGCWATATPKAKPITILELVNHIVESPIGETVPSGLDLSQQEQNNVLTRISLRYSICTTNPAFLKTTLYR